jgi:hypothetical protein
MTTPLFTDPDQQLLQNYWPDQPKSAKRRPAWAWSALSAPERLALAARIGDWVSAYNQCYAVSEDHLIPPCWPKHAWLAYELAVMTWLWYSAHRDPTATAERAGEFYLRYLPCFRTRLPQTLGRSPVECRKGLHPATWRNDADQHASRWPADPNGADHHLADIDHLGAATFGFEPHRMP